MDQTNLTIYTDGGARGNPGPAGIGIVVYDQNQEIVLQHHEYIGKATNNVAEYTAVVKAFERIKEFKPNSVRFFLDSELVVKQLNQEYKIKNEKLGKLFIIIWNARQSYQDVSFVHIPRAQNKLADSLVNKALDEQA